MGNGDRSSCSDISCSGNGGSRSGNGCGSGDDTGNGSDGGSSTGHSDCSNNSTGNYSSNSGIGSGTSRSVPGRSGTGGDHRRQGSGVS